MEFGNMNVLVIIETIILFMLLCIYLKNKLNYWKRRNVFSYRPYPFFGNLLDILIGRDDFFCSIRKIYTELGADCPYFGYYILHKPILLIKDKDIIKQILVKDFNIFSNRTLHSNEIVDPFVSNTLFVLKDDIWRITRRLLAPIMSTGKMKQMVTWIQEENINMHNYTNNNCEKSVDITTLVKRFVQDASYLFVFGYDSEFAKNVKTIQGNDEVLNQTSMYRKLSTFSWAFFPSLVDIFHLNFFNIRDGYKFTQFYLHAENERKKTNEKRNDFLDLMIKLSENGVMTFGDLRRAAQAVIFYGSGSDAISFAISLCLYELAVHQDIQKELRNEIYKNLNNDGNVSYESIAKMEYLDLVVKETLRLHPFLPFVTRYANANYRIKSTGLIVEKGIQVVVPVEAIHKDPSYFEDPLKFKPERFCGEKDEGNLRYIYLPFGDGPRKCIAERMSWLLIKYGVISFLRDFSVSLAEGTKVPLEFENNAIFTNPKGGSLHLKIKKIGNVS